MLPLYPVWFSREIRGKAETATSAKKLPIFGEISTGFTEIEWGTWVGRRKLCVKTKAIIVMDYHSTLEAGRDLQRSSGPTPPAKACGLHDTLFCQQVDLNVFSVLFRGVNVTCYGLVVGFLVQLIWFRCVFLHITIAVA